MKLRKATAILLTLALLFSLAVSAQADTEEHKHEWKERTHTDPTCTQDGQTTWYCNCGEIWIEPHSALGHAWDGGVVTTQPSCEGTGVRTYTCTRCGATRTESIPAAGHKPETIPGQPATCDVNGLTEGSRCSVCGATLKAQSPIPAYGHNWGPWQEGKLPTCEEKGKNYSVCANCGATRYRDDIEPLGHDWDEGVVTKEAGYLEEGEILYTCRRDPSHTKTETLPVQEVPAGRTLMGMFRAGSNIPSDVAVTDLGTPLVIVKNPESGPLGSESGTLELSVEAYGGVMPYSYEWHRSVLLPAKTETLAEMLAAGWGDTAGKRYMKRAEKVSGIFTKIASQQEGVSAVMTETPLFLETEALPLSQIDLSVIVGGNSPVLTADTAGVYYCIVRDAEGTEVSSEKAEVRVPLYISQQPRNANLYGRDSVTLVCRAAGGVPYDNGTYIFAWYNDKGEQVAFTDDGTAEVNALGEYYCLVQDFGDTILQSDTVMVYSAKPLTITGESDVYYIMPGGDPVDVRMEVRGGVPPYELTWSGNDEEVLVTYIADEGIHAWNTETPGVYFLTVTDSRGETAVGAGTVEYKPLTVSLQPKDGMLDDSGYYELEIRVSDGKEPYTYELYWNDDLLDMTGNIVTVGNAGEYYFHVEDADGRWVDSRRVTVEDYEFAIDHIATPGGSVIRDGGPIVSVAAVLKNRYEKNVSYRWTWRPASGNASSEPLQSTENHSLATRPGIYLCIATNEAGKTATASAEITYEGGKPVILVEPRDWVFYGKDQNGTYSAVMKISAVGSDNREDTLRYEWQVKSGGGWASLPDSTGIGVTQMRRSSGKANGVSGIYRCIVTDPATGESVTSREALAYYGNNEVAISLRTHPNDYYLELEYEILCGIPPYDISLYRRDATKRLQTNPEIFNYSTVRIKHRTTAEAEGAYTVYSMNYFMQDGKSIKYTARYYFEIVDGAGHTFKTKDFDYTGYLDN